MNNTLRINLRGISIFLFLFALFLGSPVQAEPSPKIDNGLYYITESKEGEAVTTLDDVKIHLGEKFTSSIEKIYFKSVSNDNETYSLMLQKTGPFSQDYTLFALYVDGFCLRFNGSGSNENKIFDINGQFHSVPAANAFTKFLKVQPLKRTHPGYALSTRFVTSKNAFSNEEPLPVTLEIKNVGTVSVTFQVGGKNRGERDNQFGFTAYDGMKPVPDTGNLVNFGGLSVNKTIKPGDVFTKEVDLRKWFTFQKAGTYEITGAYYLAFLNPDMKDYFVTWEDYATASFYLKIE